MDKTAAYRAASREAYVDVAAPAGTSEWLRDNVLAAARQSDKFGGPTADYGEPGYDDNDVPSSWDISIVFLYPIASEVVILNSLTGDMWRAAYTVDGETVTFGDAVPANVEIVTAGKEALVRARENGARAPRLLPIRESGRIARASIVRESSDPGAEAVPENAVGVQLISAGPGNPVSKNWYSKQFIEGAIASGIFDGVQCYYDHPTAFEDENQPERSVGKIAGFFSESRLGEFTTDDLGAQPAALATMRFLEGDSLAKQIMLTAREYDKLYPGGEFAGLSIFSYGVADGTVDHDGEAYHNMTEMVDCISVDLVTHAGARGGFLFAQQEKTTMSKRGAAIVGKPQTPFVPPAPTQESAVAKATREGHRRHRDTLLARPETKEAAFKAAGIDVGLEIAALNAEQNAKLDEHFAPEFAALDAFAESVAAAAPATSGDPGGNAGENAAESLTNEQIDAMNADERAAALRKFVGRATGEGAGTSGSPKAPRMDAHAESAEIKRLSNELDRINREAQASELIKKHGIPASHEALFRLTLANAPDREGAEAHAKAFADAHLPTVATHGLMIGTQREGAGTSSKFVPKFSDAVDDEDEG